jgi:hypothetical protein
MYEICRLADSSQPLVHRNAVWLLAALTQNQSILLSLAPCCKKLMKVLCAPFTPSFKIILHLPAVRFCSTAPLRASVLPPSRYPTWPATIAHANSSRIVIVQSYYGQTLCTSAAHSLPHLSVMSHVKCFLTLARAEVTPCYMAHRSRRCTTCSTRWVSRCELMHALIIHVTSLRQRI